MDPKALFNAVLEVSRDYERAEVNQEHQHIMSNLRGWLENSAKFGNRKYCINVRFRENADNLETLLRAGGFTVTAFVVTGGGYKVEIRW